MKYLLNFLCVNENHQDVADYERLYNHCLELINSNKNRHESFYKVLRTALYKFSNKHLKSITLRLLAALNVEVNIDTEIISDLLKDTMTCNSTFLLLKKLKSFESREIIEKYLYNDSFESKEFFEYLKIEESEVKTFLSVKNPIYVRKQLIIMNYLQQYTNFDYFLPFIGSNNKSLCYLIFEHIVLILEKKKEQQNTFTTSFADSKNVLINVKNQSLSFKEPIRVESPSNFLIYFLPFLDTKEIIFQAILDKNVALIESLLGGYIIIDKPINISRHTHLYKLNYTMKSPIELEFEQENVNFDFLFEERSYKAITDCVEL